MDRGHVQSVEDALAKLPPGTIADVLRAVSERLYSPLERQIVSVPLLGPAEDLEFVRIQNEMRESIMQSFGLPARLLDAREE